MLISSVQGFKSISLSRWDLLPFVLSKVTGITSGMAQTRIPDKGAAFTHGSHCDKGGVNWYQSGEVKRCCGMMEMLG